MDNEMIERVRQVAIESWRSKCPNDQNSLNVLVLEQEFYTDIIKAMHKPTEIQLNAAREWSIAKYGRSIGNDAATGCWQAMLDAITNG